MSFADTYLVTDKLTTFSEAEVDAAEAQFGVRFPIGYKDFVTTLGKGEYCGFVWMYGPAEIVADRASRRSQLEEYAHHWEDGFDVLSRERLRECIVLGASIDADLIVFHPDAPDALYELPRHDSTIYHIGTSVEQAMAWYRQERLKVSFSYFESYIDRAGREAYYELGTSLDDLKDWLVQLGRYDHLETKLNEEPGVSLSTYLLSKGQVDQAAPELSEVTAYYKSFGGYVTGFADGVGRLSARLVHDTRSNTDLIQEILEYLRGKPA